MLALRLGASPKAARLAAERRDKLGGFGDKEASLTLAEVVALGSKCYSEFLTNSSESFHKFKAKSMAKQHRKQLTGTPGEAVTSYRFESRSVPFNEDSSASSSSSASALSHMNCKKSGNPI